MAKTAWPTDTELTDRLNGLGVTAIPDGVDLEFEVEQAVEMLERESGISPFLADASAVTYNYDPTRSNILDLRFPWFEIDSVTVDGTALTLNEDYWLHPINAPFRSIEFNQVLFGEPQTVVVAGKRGMGANIPARAWAAVLDYAAGSVHRVASMAGTVDMGEVKRLKQGTVEWEFGGSGSGSDQDTASKLQNAAITVFRSFRRMGVGNYS
jgi:hypothetical protein